MSAKPVSRRRFEHHLTWFFLSVPFTFVLYELALLCYLLFLHTSQKPREMGKIRKTSLLSLLTEIKKLLMCPVTKSLLEICCSFGLRFNFFWSINEILNCQLTYQTTVKQFWGQGVLWNIIKILIPSQLLPT